MTMFRKIIRSQLIPEGILIVVSILIAFAIDAWWEEQQEREEEVRVLKSLIAEFQENADRLPAPVQLRELVAENAKAVVDEIQTVGIGNNISVTAEQLFLMTVHGTFEATSGAFDTMLQSGDLRFIENQALREQLVRWPQIVADAVENDYFLRTVAGPRAFEYLAVRVDLGLSDRIATCRLDPASLECPTASFELEATRELSGIASHINGWSRESAAELKVVRQEALSLVRVLSGELVSD